MTSYLLCPYCVQSINRTPRNNSICDSCGNKVFVRQGRLLTGKAARQHDDDSDPPHRRRSVEEHQALLREFNHRALQYFKGEADAFPFLQISCAEDECSCPFCLAQGGKIIKTAEATPDMVPPHAECTSDYSQCRCTFIAITRENAVQLGLLNDHEQSGRS